ncbi:MAG: hypothetical protein EOO38_04075 [Cytophagaceae bacterium]|nr:MAG: hypothetical protein EOO38_04075 [Cytophagaceae bacterium]
MPASDRFNDDPGFEVVGQAAPEDMPQTAPDDDFEADPGFEVVKRGITKADADVMAYIKATEELQIPVADEAEDQDKVPEAALHFVQANKPIAGMDQEIAALGLTPEEARKKASRILYERPGLYDNVGATPTTYRLHGLQLDLGASTCREPGFLGLDLSTYGDYGIAIHDLNLGLKDFPDGCARAIRLVNSLWYIVEDRSPAFLLEEIQRVLCIGGELIYEDKRPLFVSDNTWPTPGLALVQEYGRADYATENPAGGVRQVFIRVHPRVPAYHGAEPDFQPLGGDIPIDVAMAMYAYNTAPAKMAMANLIHKTANKTVRIAKSEPMKQVVIGVVLAPNELDSQGDTISAEDIEKAAHGFMGTSRIIGSEHGAPIEAHPVESYIAPQDLTFDGPDGRTIVTKGSWVLGVKVNDPEQWAQVMSDGYTGFSIGGFGLRDDL